MVGSSLVSATVVSVVAGAAGAEVTGAGEGTVSAGVVVVLGVVVSTLGTVSGVDPLVKLKSNGTPSTLHLPMKKTKIRIRIKKNNFSRPIGFTLISISLSKIEFFLTW